MKQHGLSLLWDCIWIMYFPQRQRPKDTNKVLMNLHKLHLGPSFPPPPLPPFLPPPKMALELCLSSGPSGWAAGVGLAQPQHPWIQEPDPALLLWFDTASALWTCPVTWSQPWIPLLGPASSPGGRIWHLGWAWPPSLGLPCSPQQGQGLALGDEYITPPCQLPYYNWLPTCFPLAINLLLARFGLVTGF